MVKVICFIIIIIIIDVYISVLKIDKYTEDTEVTELCMMRQNETMRQSDKQHKSEHESAVREAPASIRRGGGPKSSSATYQPGRESRRSMKVE